MVINGPTLLDIYIESVSQLASCVKKDLGIIKMRVIIFFFFAIVSFLCQILTKPTYFRQDQHMWKWWDYASKHKNILVINSSYWRYGWIRYRPPPPTPTPPQLPPAMFTARIQYKQVQADLTHCQAASARPELCEEPWRLLGKDSL